MAQMEAKTYIVQDFQSAKVFLQNANLPVILQNAAGSTRYYGARVVYAMLQSLQQEFTDKVLDIVIDTADDYAGHCFIKRELNKKRVL
jgi:hypothetical protein